MKSTKFATSNFEGGKSVKEILKIFTIIVLLILIVVGIIILIDLNTGNEVYRSK